MKSILTLGFAATLLLCGLPAHAESLRCNGHSTEVGDSRLSVLYKCGEPVLKDSFCAAAFTLPAASAAHPAPVWVLVPGNIAPCLQVDEWLYDRGPGNMMATVRFQSGVVQAIRYGRSPQ
jgi:Protein of unknown function (DUF2845)